LAKWDETVFRARVLESAHARGIQTMHEAAVLAGLDRKYFREDLGPREGRNVKHIFALAEALGADPAYLMGLHDRPWPVEEMASMVAMARRFLKVLDDAATAYEQNAPAPLSPAAARIAQLVSETLKIP
jgi:hypothetical protein